MAPWNRRSRSLRTGVMGCATWAVVWRLVRAVNWITEWHYVAPLRCQQVLVARDHELRSFAVADSMR